MPVFWALYELYGSRWIIQATQMNGIVFGYHLRPDQMPLFGSILVVALIPVSEFLIFPILSLIGIRKPLQKMSLGGILAGCALLAAGLLDIQIEKTSTPAPQIDYCQLRFFNTMQCDYTLYGLTEKGLIINRLDAFDDNIKVNGEIETLSVTFIPINKTAAECQKIINSDFHLKRGKAISYYVKGNSFVEYIDDTGRSNTGDPFVRLLVNSNVEEVLLLVDKNHLDKLVRFNGTTSYTDKILLPSSEYDLFIKREHIATIKLEQGQVATIPIVETLDSSYSYSVIEITKANSVHMMWQIPQYLFMALSDIMISGIGLSFSYSEAPKRLKSVVQAFWLLGISFGNLIDIIVVGAKIFDSQV